MIYERFRVAFAGSVTGSARALEALIRNGVNVVGVLALSEAKADGVSGYCNLEALASRFRLPCMSFTDINSTEIMTALQAWDLDALFVIGLSQMVGEDLIKLPRLGCVGFHPTWLPLGRGRAPLAWLTLEGVPGAATFFFMTKEVDAGPILVQEPFCISEGQYAGEVAEVVYAAMDRALDRWLPSALRGEWTAIPQDERLATFYGRRAPNDGIILWNRSAREITALVRATAYPYPGAYTYVKGQRMVVWRCEVDTTLRYKGVVGRILEVSATGTVVVQTGDGLLRLTEIEFPDAKGGIALRAGMKLGYEPQDEIHRLRKKVEDLECKVSQLLST